MESTKVSWTLGYTLNNGNFQSLRLDAQVEDHVREGESTKDASTTSRIQEEKAAILPS